MLERIFNFALCLAFYGSIVLVIEHRKALFDFPKVKDMWEELTNDFFGTEKSTKK
ncbi:hypothetical protein OXT66_03070 [Lentilactobacillus senioris]|uniref:hypothetical protein n=1 Tax=Lentilactobacillus senioris TaxID=931534 RepID=UPI00227F83A8|nr:hypothetical protein [Lentilactobacillus senioris]MCY9806530.1 hypothetical protein [Lentilactobacillus senioris]